MIRCAKNASTMTIRIGTRAPLREIRFISGVFQVQSAWEWGPNRPRRMLSVPGRNPRSNPLGTPRTIPPRRLAVLLEGGDVVEVAVALGVVESVADRKPVRNLESDVAAPGAASCHLGLVV